MTCLTIYFRDLLDEDHRTSGKISKQMNMFGERIMQTEEIGAALMKALQVDRNGAVYVVNGNLPIIQWPAFENALLMSFLILGRILAL